MLTCKKLLKHKYFIVAISSFVAVFILLIFRVYLYGSIKGAYHRAFNTPALINTYKFVDLQKSQNEDDEKKKFYQIYTQKKGIFGLKQARRSIEHTPHTLYIYTDDGHLTMIVDLTRDIYSNREFIVEHPYKVKFGYFDDEFNFLELDFPDEHHQNIVLEVEYGPGEKVRI